jgi:hypothetical protein
VPYFAKETIEVAVGRIIGFRRLANVLDQQMRPVSLGP